MKFIKGMTSNWGSLAKWSMKSCIRAFLDIKFRVGLALGKSGEEAERGGERGDVPGWVLVVLMTTGLVTAIWTIAAPRLSAILRNSLDSMNGIR